jgi:uncharacterized membrane protein
VKLLSTAVLLTATVTTGLMAGLFAAFSYAVMPALRRGEDRTFVAAMRQINQAILNGWFLSCFVGALLALVAATALHAAGAGTGGDRMGLPFVVGALVLYLVVLGVTAAVNVPLNDQLEAAVAGGSGDPASVREQFEARWVAWNHVRTAASAGAFGLLTWALVLLGRATP